MRMLDGCCRFDGYDDDDDEDDDNDDVSGGGAGRGVVVCVL